ncbi:MAG: sialate O-acetylesterase [Bacteroidota bacterium]
MSHYTQVCTQMNAKPSIPTQVLMSHLFSLFLWGSCLLYFPQSIHAQTEGKHLFILSGQSNMYNLKPEESFTPTVEAEFGKDHVIVVKDALGGQPIRRWYKAWKPAEGDSPQAEADLYDSLMTKVFAAIEGESIKSVTFLWMQGERDAREKHGQVYEKSLRGLYKQLQKDLKYRKIHFVIGRLSDFDMQNERYPHWTMVREIHEKVGDSKKRFAWIDTDDLNDGVNRKGKAISNDLHMSAAGYVEMGKRFAEASIRLIQAR